MDKKLQMRERLFREKHKEMVKLCDLVGDDYLRKVVLQMVTEMARDYDVETPMEDAEIDRQIWEHEEAIRDLKRRKRHD